MAGAGLVAQPGRLPRAEASQGEYPAPWTANGILVCCMVAYALSLLDRQILALMVDPVRQDLGLSDFQIGLVQGLAFAIFYSILTIPCGRLADRLSRKKLIAGGVIFWSTATVCCGFATGFWSLFFARMCVGVGEAVLVPAAYSLLADSFRADRLIRATAIFGFGALAGAGVAMLLGGVLVDQVAASPDPPFGLTGVAGWRIVFFIAGAPGFILGTLFLFLPEPSRKGAMQNAAGEIVRPGLKETFGYLWRRRRIYAPIYASPVLLGTIVYGAISWFPTFLVRNFGMSYTEVGLFAGLIQIGASFVGAIIGAVLGNYMIKKGHRDAHIRALLIIAVAAIIPSVTATLFTDRTSMLAMWIVAQILLCSYLGVSMAALQLRTPNQMRALNSALCMCLGALFGAGIGSAAISGIAQFVFEDEKAIGYGMSIVSAIFAPTATLLIWSGLKPHREDPFLYGDAAASPEPVRGD